MLRSETKITKQRGVKIMKKLVLATLGLVIALSFNNNTGDTQHALKRKKLYNIHMLIIFNISLTKGLQLWSPFVNEILL